MNSSPLQLDSPGGGEFVGKRDPEMFAVAELAIGGYLMTRKDKKGGGA